MRGKMEEFFRELVKYNGMPSVHEARRQVNFAGWSATTAWTLSIEQDERIIQIA
jgi:hypothetical protein